MQTAEDPRLIHLLESLRAYELGEPDHERQHLAHMRALATVKDAFQADHFEPGHFTASGLVLSHGADALLLISHRKLRMWLQPGGHIEPTDLNLTAAARREVEEETGLSELRLVTPIFDVDVHDIPAHKQTPAHRHYDVRVLFQMPRAHALEPLSLASTQEVHAARWFRLSQLQEHPALLQDELGTDRSVVRVATKLLRAFC